MQDPYKTLGVSRDMETPDVKKAFLKLAKEHHPDKGGDAEKFKQINEAYDILKDPQKRQQYDLGGYDQAGNPRGPGNFSFSFGGDANGFEGVEEMMKDFFGHSGPMRNFRSRQPMRNRDVKITVQCTLEDIYFQTEKELNVKTPTGNRNVKLTIPVDADTGTTIRFQGLGDKSYADLPPGNLMVNVKVKEHDRYTRNDYDLFENLKINIFDVIAGCDLEVNHISGTSFRTRIKEGSQPTQTVRIKGKGMPKKDGTYGDLYIQFKPYTPVSIDKRIIKYIKENKDV